MVMVVMNVMNTIKGKIKLVIGMMVDMEMKYDLVRRMVLMIIMMGYNR